MVRDFITVYIDGINRQFGASRRTAGRAWLVAAVLLGWLCLAAPSWAARHAYSPDSQIVGLWQDEKDPLNIIRFLPDHTLRIYVPRKTGEYINVRWMAGTWALHGHVLKLKLTTTTGKGVAEVRHTAFHVSFVRGRMVVRQNGKLMGRQRRISEAQLKKYLW